MKKLNHNPYKVLVAGTLTAATALLALPTQAQVSVPNEFSANTAAVASEVNANFEELVDAINALQAQINTLTISDLTDSGGGLEGAAQDAIFENFLEQVLPYLQGGEDAQGNPAIFFSGVNVHVNNGEGDDSGTINGRGNLIIGYDVAESSYDPYDGGNGGATGGADNSVEDHFYCYDQTSAYGYDVFDYADDVDSCTASGGTWTEETIKTGSHNLVIGDGHTYTSVGGIVAGHRNINAAPAAVTLGYTNRALNATSAVTGGAYNTSSGIASSVSGGGAGFASASQSSVSGGYANLARSLNTSVSGGNANTAGGATGLSGNYASVSGGSNNEATGPSSSVSGGRENNATASGSSASGGEFNSASGEASSVIGGTLNTASDDFSSVTGGSSNVASGEASIVTGGTSNLASGEFSSVTGGESNEATAESATVSGGRERSAESYPGWAAGSLYQLE